MWKFAKKKVCAQLSYVPMLAVTMLVACDRRAQRVPYRKGLTDNTHQDALMMRREDILEHRMTTHQCQQLCRYTARLLTTLQRTTMRRNKLPQHVCLCLCQPLACLSVPVEAKPCRVRDLGMVILSPQQQPASDPPKNHALRSTT